MNNTQRRETRYFFPSIRLPEILAIIRNVLGKEQVFEFPVTETVYLTLGKEAGYAFPTSLRVRTRRYIKILTHSVIIDNSPVFLEIKKEIQGETNHKKRILIEGIRAIKRLSLANGIDGLPKLITYAATQSSRFHWSIGLKGRLTLDADIRLFGFRENQLLEAEYICDFGEGKLEFKFEDESESLHEIKIVKATQCIRREYSYLERRTRQCMKIWQKQELS